MRTAKDRPSWWSVALAAIGGTVIGLLVGGGSGLLVARAIGLNESIADYGPPFYLTLGGAWLFGLLGCYLALAALNDPKAIVTVVILALLLPCSAAVVDPLAGAIARWFSMSFGTLITTAVVLYVLLPTLSPLAARMLAAMVPWERRS